MLVILMALLSHVVPQAGSNDAHIEMLLKMLSYETTEAVPTASTTPVILPFFEDASSSTNVTAQLGSHVTLHCRVNDLSDRTSVSWLRRHEGKLRLLSVGAEPYSPDGRYSAAFSRPNDWQLRLEFAQDKDQGQYECQVSSHPPIVYVVYLHVVVPELEIADERGLPVRHKYYNEGSTIELKCVISRAPQPSHFITWRHGVRVLNYDTTRGGISVKTDITETGAKSRLFIANALSHDSGNYSCALGEVASTSVSVHVLNGETPAAMQHGGAGGRGAPLLPLLLLVLSCR